MKNDDKKTDAGTDKSLLPEAPPVVQRKSMFQSHREKKIAGASSGIGTIVGVLLMVIINALSGPAVDEQPKPAGEEVVASNETETPADVKTEEAPTDVKTEAPKPEVPTIVDSKPTEEPEVPTIVAAPTEHVTIKIIDENIAQFARYTVRNAEAKVAETIPVIATKATGVDHTKILVEKDATDESVVIITLQRESRPEQAIVSLVLTDEHILVSFRKEPTEEGLSSTREALLAFESALGVETKGAWEGTGTSRRLLLAKN